MKEIKLDLKQMMRVRGVERLGVTPHRHCSRFPRPGEQHGLLGHRLLGQLVSAACVMNELTLWSSLMLKKSLCSP